MTRQELVEALTDLKRSCIVTMTMRTKVQMVKKHRVTKEKNRYFDAVYKTSRINCIVGFNYETSVNNQREREQSPSDFVAQERVWGEHVSEALIEHNNKFYVQVKIERVLSTFYEFEDERIDYETFKDFLVVKKEPARQELEEPVILRSYSLESIVSITYGGTETIVAS